MNKVLENEPGLLELSAGREVGYHGHYSTVGHGFSTLVPIPTPRDMKALCSNYDCSNVHARLVMFRIKDGR